MLGDQRKVGRTSLAAVAAAALALALSACGGASTPAADAAELSALLRVADATLGAGDLRSATALFQRAHQLYPGSPAPLTALGRLYNQMGAHGEALEAFRQANALARKDTDILRGLANTLVALDQPQQAFAYYEEILALDPDDVRAYNGKGVVYDMLGQHEAAQDTYRQGLTLAPGDVALRNNLGLSLALLGDYREAIAALGALAAEPTASIRTRQNLALVYGLAGQPKAAAEIAGTDLSPEMVEQNLAYYALLRQLVGEQAAARLAPERMEPHATASP